MPGRIERETETELERLEKMEGTRKLGLNLRKLLCVHYRGLI